jgi:hypothetical protein
MAAVKFVLGQLERTIEFPHRDFGILQGPRVFMPRGEIFIGQLGVFECFDVAQGRAREFQVTRDRIGFAAVTRQLANDVSRDRDLLSFDYTYSFSTKPRKMHGGAFHGFKLQGRPAGVDSRPKGFLTVTILDLAPDQTGRPAAVLDLRSLGGLPTDDMGVLRAHRRKAAIQLAEILEDLLAFLESSKEAKLSIVSRW